MFKKSFLIVTVLMLALSGKSMAASCTASSAQLEAFVGFTQQCMVLDLARSGFPQPDLRGLEGRITPISISQNQQIFLLTRYNAAVSLSAVGECDPSTGTIVILTIDANFYQPLKKIGEDVAIDGFNNFGTRRTLADCGVI
jgi:hypothetical protein